ncbi:MULTISPECIES: NAD(P)-dependent oxidoreductase [unclassified Microbacterium]|uniref:NAD-dependent epimerase/dehydratase family protein n=1 Tax=unclassified Microbacterium TaxID=2609290 RepID=UPI00214B4E1B|nr:MULTISPECIES: NAD(P)-dependent oxidoreductase [unclassified Microbacterium]MCR2811376.1 NAD(P)-dependent oxidoreductase [Microbacterium sp. zg.B185]WIM19578.1 NAD(P)-dependent oxidoreductase [Microbacterium sp. zg-B185]
MTVLVTGVGFIGGYAVRDLLDAGEDVAIYGYLGGNGDPNGDLPELDYIDKLIGGSARDRLRFEVGDVTDLDAMTAAAEKFGAHRILHLATVLSASAEEHPYAAAQVNVTGTANVFETAVRLDMDKVVWTSSSSVYGPRSVPPSGLISDDCPFDPVYTYGAAKLFGERLSRSYAEKHGLNVTALRPFRVYGFGEHVKLGRGGGSSWLANLLYYPVIGAGPSAVPFGTRGLDFTYVEDVADGLVKALGWQDPSGSGSYIAAGDYRRIAEAYEFVRRMLPDADITLLEDDGDLASGATKGFELRGDSSRAVADFGYRPRHTMEAGIFKTINLTRDMVGLPSLDIPDELVLPS